MQRRGHCRWGLCLEVSVQEGLYPGALCPGWHLSVQWGMSMGSLSGGFCPVGSLYGGSLSRGLSRRVSIQGSLSRLASLCPVGYVHGVFSRRVSIWGSLSGRSLSRGLSRGSLSGGLGPGGSVHWVSVQGFFCPVGSLSEGVCPGVSILRCLCLGECLSRVGSLSRGVSVHGGLSMGSLGVSVQEGLYQVFLSRGLSSGVCVGVSIQGVSVHGVSVQEGLYLGSLCPEGFLSRVGSLFWWSLSSGVCSWGLCLGFFVHEVSIWGLCPGCLSRGCLSGGLSRSVCPWGLCLGFLSSRVSIWGSLSRGSLYMGAL